MTRIICKNLLIVLVAQKNKVNGKFRIVIMIAICEEDLCVK